MKLCHKIKSDSNTRECKLGNSKEVLNTHPSQKLQDISHHNTKFYGDGK